MQADDDHFAAAAADDDDCHVAAAVADNDKDDTAAVGDDDDEGDDDAIPTSPCLLGFHTYKQQAGDNVGDHGNDRDVAVELNHVCSAAGYQ